MLDCFIMYSSFWNILSIIISIYGVCFFSVVFTQQKVHEKKFSFSILTADLISLYVSQIQGETRKASVIFLFKNNNFLIYLLLFFLRKTSKIYL